mmetsp:Transcript_27323/g.41967  ORF Transcript_27323/g.41967 Transcript_27323/m.41967 type:complete len:351 (+) Transcript_27323:26-1078(+)
MMVMMVRLVVAGIAAFMLSTVHAWTASSPLLQQKTLGGNTALFSSAVDEEPVVSVGAVAVDKEDDTESVALLDNIKVTSLITGQPVDLVAQYESCPNVMLIFGTYAADFNAIEYAQRLRHYLPKLKERGINKFGFILNCKPSAAEALCKYVDLSTEEVEILIDEIGVAGRAFGVGRGWKPDDESMNPFLKLFGMLFGLGAYGTLPAVIGGYIGNPITPQPWIEDALLVGQLQNRWPDTVLNITKDESGVVSDVENKFNSLPWGISSWKRRPLELATLRLQSMMGISLKHWEELAPKQEGLNAGVLTQLGGCFVTGPAAEKVYVWKDPGICAVSNFENILRRLDQKKTVAA